MNAFESREKAFENKFAHDSEIEFKISARKNKYLGLWAAKKMQMDPANMDAYAKRLVEMTVEAPGEDAVLSKLKSDLAASGIDASEDEIGDESQRLYQVARLEIITE